MFGDAHSNPARQTSSHLRRVRDTATRQQRFRSAGVVRQPRGGCPATVLNVRTARGRSSTTRSTSANHLVVFHLPRTTDENELRPRTWTALRITFRETTVTTKHLAEWHRGSITHSRRSHVPALEILDRLAKARSVVVRHDVAEWNFMKASDFVNRSLYRARCSLDAHATFDSLLLHSDF